MIVIEKLNSEFGEIKILKARAEELFFYMQEGYFQSEADRNGISLAPYVHAIYGLLAQVDARDILLIGCGGGSLGTMLGKTASRITIVDKNAESFRIAREYFGLPRTIECHVQTAENFCSARDTVTMLLYWMHMTAIVSRSTCLQLISFDWFGLTWIELVVASWQTCMHGTI